MAPGVTRKDEKKTSFFLSLWKKESIAPELVGMCSLVDKKTLTEDGGGEEMLLILSAV